MLEWLIAAVVVLYLFGMLATRNMVKALKNDLFGNGSAGDIVVGLLTVIFWPVAQLVATFLVRGPGREHRYP